MENKLKTKIEKLCKDIEKQHFADFPSLTDYSVTFKAGRKFCKIIIADANGNDKSVWGFSNLTHERFMEGDVLLAQGWAGPALNKPRGNVYAGFEINRRTVYGPGYCSGVVAGTKRDGSFV